MIPYKLFTGLNMKAEDYQKLVDKKTQNSPMVKDCVFAFIIGGFICVLGQALSDLYSGVFGQSEDISGTLTSMTLVFLSTLFTGIGLYDKLAKIGGAGTLVPITGFANAMASPAVEFKKEGLILGIGPKLFAIAGSVIVYGTLASVVYGIIYYTVSLFM